jgi:hypothetical protein
MRMRALPSSSPDGEQRAWSGDRRPSRSCSSLGRTKYEHKNEPRDDTLIIIEFTTIVVDPKLIVTDPDPTFQRVTDPDQTFDSKVPDPLSDPTFFLKKYYFESPKMAF